MDGVDAVVTTGIYCRPGCSARPNADHVGSYLTCAAAEADGYRACLRCRPYHLPSVPPGISSEIVCRAVGLVLDGVLDEEREDTLASLVGVSPRHLRRLFDAELGVSPHGLARSARAHFARRLLDETDLTITEVAFAAGFGSTRHFNRICRSLFRGSPQELRAKRRRSDRNVADGGLTLRLLMHGRLDWPTMLAALERTAVPGVESTAGGRYARTICVHGDPGVLELWCGDDGQPLVRLHLPHWRGLVYVVQRARGVLNLDLESPNGRPPGTWDPFEVGVFALLDHGCTEATSDLVSRLARHYGRPVRGLASFGLSHNFPTPSALAEADLSRLNLPRAMQRDLHRFAAASVDLQTTTMERTG